MNDTVNMVDFHHIKQICEYGGQPPYAPKHMDMVEIRHIDLEYAQLNRVIKIIVFCHALLMYTCRNCLCNGGTGIHNTTYPYIARYGLEEYEFN